MSFESLLTQIENSDLGLIAAEKVYDQDALSFLPNTTRTINYYKDEGLIPERQKKSKFSFEELIWFRIVFELKNIGINHELIQRLKDYAFAPIHGDVLNEVLNQANKHFEAVISPILKEVPKEHQEDFKKTVREAMMDKSHIQKKLSSNLRFHLMTAIQSRSAAEIRLYSNGDVTFHLQQMEDVYKAPLNTYVSISLTQILAFYLSKDYIDAAFAQKALNEEELLLLQFIREKKYKSIEVTYKNKNIDLIKLTTKVNVDPAQRLYEIMLTGAYEDIVIKNHAGKVAHSYRTVKIRPKKQAK